MRLIRATTRRDEPPLPLLLKLGFNREYLEPLAPKLPALCRVLFEPCCVEYPYDMNDWKLGESLKSLEPFQDKLNVVTGLALDNGRAKKDGAGDHARAGSTFLTAAQPVTGLKRGVLVWPTE